MEPTKPVSGDIARQKFASLVELVRHHAAERPDQTALIFLPDGETEVGRLTYAELDRRARLFAARLQAQGLAGHAVLLMLPSSIYYVVAFLGSLYAKAVPVPVYPPTSSMHAERVAQIVRDCNAKGVILTTSGQHDGIHAKLSQFLPQGLGCEFLSVDESSAIQEEDWVEPELASDALAYLQYTSGSTSEPRGVMVTHANLLEHCRYLQAACQQDHTDVFVTWLPLFHDMGLISGLIQPLYLGATAVLMPSMAFLQKPLRWLGAISRYRGTTSFAPSFAYELCAATLDEAQLKTFDLSSWNIAMNGAEPVRALTIRKFCERFAPCGFRPEAMNPGYGLAEATLTVSCSARLTPPSICRVDSDALERNRFIPAPPGQERTSTLVSSGRSWLDIRTVMVEPDTGRVCAEGEVGEIWVTGPTVAAGYWQRPEQTRSTFQACLPNGEGPFLRTGDLGVLHQGELYVTGRIKDLIIIRGRNHYPQDIEQTVFRAHAAAEIGHGAAFSIEDGNEEKLVIVQEIRRSWRKRFDGAEVAQAICAAVAEQHGLQVHALLLLNPASVHITSSGKIQRQACKADYLNNRFEPLYVQQADREVDSPQQQIGDASDDLPNCTDEVEHRYQAIALWLATAIGQKKKLPAAQVSYDIPFSRFGLDSMELVVLSGELSSWLGRTVEPTQVYNYPNINRLAQYLSKYESGKMENVAPWGHANRSEPLAIVGMACRFPQADSIDAYWRLLETGTDAICEVPPSRWRADDYYDAGTSPRPGMMNTRWGGFIGGVDEFDSNFFGISPREAESMDPQQRLLLETAWHALEDAGIPPDTLAGSNTGVFIGISLDDYKILQLSHGAGIDGYAGSGNALCIAANRISYFLDLHGPSLAVDTACSSSLAALHYARMSLLAGECDIALVGGINLLLSPVNFVILSQAGMMSADGRCKTFDAGANGYVRGEGCGMIVLKRNKDAVHANDRIQALIRGTALNQDGKSNGLTAPNGLAQQAVIRQALATGGVEARQVSYVEAHGTGTSLGDPIEVNALKQIYGLPSDGAPPLWIGSVKTNIGHLEAGAGIAGLIKTTLALQHRTIPRHLHLQQLNPLISLADSRMQIPTELQPWTTNGSHPRLAGINSFGFGGANAHAILQEAPVSDSDAMPQPVPDGSLQLLTLSAKSQNALHQLAVQQADSLGGDTQKISIFDLCYTANVRRTHHPYRLALWGRSISEMEDRLRCFGKGENADGTLVGFSQKASEGKVAFLFTGQGSQYWRMAQGLYGSHAGFRAILDRCDAILQGLIGESLLANYVYSDEDKTAELNQTIHAQPALFAVEYALAKLWQGCGIRPDYLIGHSLGEYVAACLAGVFSLEDGLKLVAHRGRLMQESARHGAMFAVRGSDASVSKLLAQFESSPPKDCAVAARNSSEDAVLSGDEAALQQWLTHWMEQGGEPTVTVTPLHVNRAFHSPLMAAMTEEFARIASEVSYALPKIPVVSNVSGTIAGNEIASADYWVKHVLAPVQFAAGLKAIGVAGCSVFIEVGPHPVLSAFGQKMVPDAVWLHSLRRKLDDNTTLLENLAQLYVRGGRVDWKRWTEERTGTSVHPPKPITLVPYPFQKDRYWFKSRKSPSSANVSLSASDHPLLGHKLDLPDTVHRHRFENVLSEDLPAFVTQHRIFDTAVLPAAAMLEWMRAAAASVHGVDHSDWLLEEIVFKKAVAFRDHLAVEMQTIVDVLDQGRMQVACFSRSVDEEKKNWEECFSAVASTLSRNVIRQRLISSDLTQVWPEHALEEHYERLAKFGLNFGPLFRGVKRLWRQGQEEALMWIETALPTDEASYLLHPVVLDSCVHIPMLFEIKITAGHILVPIGVRRFSIHGRLPRKLWSRATWRGNIEPGCYEVDVSLFDEAGEALVEIEGLQYAEVPRGALARIETDISSIQEPDCYDIEWAELATAQVKPQAIPGTWLVFAADNKQALDWQSQFNAAGESAVAVYPGTAFCQTGHAAYSVDVQKTGDWQQLFGTLASTQIELRGLLLDVGPSTDEQENVVADSTYRVAEMAFQMLQHFLRVGEKNRPEIVVCTRGAHIVDESCAASLNGLAQSALTGLVKSVIAEYPHLKCVQVDLDPSENNVRLDAVRTAVAQLNGAGHIALRQGQWYVAQLRQHELTAGSLNVRADATYLITGGLRGIGLAAAQWLVEQGARSLLLLGRTVPTDCELALANMRAAGARVDALAIDVTDAAAVESAVTHIALHMKPLAGVLHGAGLTDDMPLEKLGWSRFAAVMDPKVHGAWNLHTATLNANLDFFALFSSISSFIGAPGQTNYTVANSFLDALAHYRVQLGLKAVSINWGVWSETGIAVRRQLVDQLAEHGVQGMSTERGLQALGAVLAAQPVQVCIAALDWPRYTTAMARQLPYSLLSRMTAMVEPDAIQYSQSGVGEALDFSGLTPDETSASIQTYLLEKVARVLRLNVGKQAELGPRFLHLRLNELGLDSLMAIELRNRILADLSVDVPLQYFIGGAEVGEGVELIRGQLMMRQVTAGEDESEPNDAEREEYTL